MSETKRITFFLVEGFQPLDLCGPMDAFAAANAFSDGAYHISTAALSKSTIVAETGLRVVPDTLLSNQNDVGTLVFCGGRGARTSNFSKSEEKIVLEAISRADRIVGICTGAFLLARFGLASNKQIATHWRYAEELADKYVDADVNPDAIFVQDGKVWSSAGVTAGIDLALELIGIDYGRAIASAVARQLIVFLRRTGGQSQFSEFLSVQSAESGRFGNLLEWILENIGRTISIEEMAARVSTGPRQFSRQFKKQFGVTPGRYIENLRLDKSRHLIGNHGARIDAVARTVGYKSTAGFRRAFERKYAVSPSQYRLQFYDNKD